MEIGNKVSIINTKEIGIIENFICNRDQFGGIIECPIVRIIYLAGNKRANISIKNVNYLKTVNPSCIHIIK